MNSTGYSMKVKVRGGGISADVTLAKKHQNGNKKGEKENLIGKRKKIRWGKKKVKGKKNSKAAKMKTKGGVTASILYLAYRGRVKGVLFGKGRG
jgi:hypothetical protein